MTMDLRDLDTRKDVKGGSPKTPSPIPLRQFQQQQPNGFFRSNLFIFLMGQVVTFLVGVIFFAIGWGKLSQQFMEGQEWRVQAQTRMERMDSVGTNNGKYESQAARTRLDNLEGRLKSVEDEARKIDVIKEKIDRLEGNRTKP